MKIQSIQQYEFNTKNINKNNNNIKKESSNLHTTNPLSYGITFEGIRVDKGLARFFEVNEHCMPKTVKKYILSLDDKAIKTPLTAQAEAFSLLKTANTVEDIKNAYPDEELFQNLKNPDETRATRGILGVFRENKDLFDIANQSILKDKQNFTVWLVKKLFLEGKTLEEINKDFKQEADSDFLGFFNEKENAEEPVKFSTIKALGIQTPEFEYTQSLRYTRDGYSDIVGQTISAAQRKFWDSMPPEERTARAKKKVERFEKWWNSIPQDKKLEMIAFQADELEMLEKYNSSEFHKYKKSAQNTTETEHESELQTSPRGFRKHVNVQSTLSDDDLFKIWAGNNLKIFQANLTERDKEIINNKKLQRRSEAWNAMTPEEKTEYLENLKTGSEYLRFAVIQAWNENPEILTELSYYLKKNNIERSTDILYGTEAFSDYMSKTMSKFWEINPTFAQNFGESIRNAHYEIKEAVANGTFETLKSNIIKAKFERMKSTAMEIRNYREILTDDEYNSYPDYMKHFIDEYRHAPGVDYKTLPSKYLKDFFKLAYENLTPEQIDSWIKGINELPLDDNDIKNIRYIIDFSTFESEKMNRTLEATLAEEIYNCTHNPDVYVLPAAYCKLAMKQIMEGYDNIILTISNDKKITIPVQNHNVNVKNIDKKYNYYTDELPEFYLEKIADKYLTLRNVSNLNDDEFKNIYIQFNNYMKTYGKTLDIIFNDNNNNINIDIKKAYLRKFMENMPYILKIYGFDFMNNSNHALIREDKIAQIDKNLKNILKVIPDSIMDVYIYEANKQLRKHIPTELLDKIIERNILGIDMNINLERDQVFPIHQLNILAAEQAIADLMYESSGNVNFYKLPFETAIITIRDEVVSKAKYPHVCHFEATNIKDEFKYTIRHKPYMVRLGKLYEKYLQELLEYYHQTLQDGKKIDSQEIMYILNPDENKKDVDTLTLERIKKVEKYLQ
ncbi:MAG: hypothetical protein MJ230_03235 [bacterium]|nr:hypothetical protein [bacterium]